jgi:hypothetical protein
MYVEWWNARSESASRTAALGRKLLMSVGLREPIDDFSIREALRLNDEFVAAAGAVSGVWGDYRYTGF